MAVDGLLGVGLMPVAAFILAAPAVAALPLAWTRARTGRTTLSLTLAGLAILGGVAASALQGNIEWRHTWTLAWLMPLTVVGAAIIADAAAASHRILASRRSGLPLAASLVDQTVLGRRALRTAEEDGRDHAAQVLHDRVLPRVAAGLGALESGSLESGATVLRALADDIREDLDQEQLVVLRAAGLGAALEGPAQHVEELGIPCVLHVVDTGRPPWEVGVAALRIAQEALNNAAAHSSANEIRIDCAVGPQRVRLDITDDGVGIDSPRPARNSRQHLGLLGMSSRAHEVDGRLLIDTTRPAGLCVSFRWPA